MHILHVVGARPNFMKAAPVLRALKDHRQTLVHTGQHYDNAMSEVFFRQLEMPPPDVNLGVGSSSHAQQTAAVMSAFEPVLLERKPDLVLVYGDVNSTVAAALVCSKLGVRVGHVEAGLRSGDRTMPEEINRLVTDQLSDLLFTPSQDANENLLREGIDPTRIHLVGNVMIDTLVRQIPTAKNILPEVPTPYALVTLHRPSNVDDLPWLRHLLTTLSDLSEQLNIIFPVHPRTKDRLQALTTYQVGTPSRVGTDASSVQRSAASDRGTDHAGTGASPVQPSEASGRGTHPASLQLLDPLPYVEFLALQCRATLIITDSGGIQEESTFLGIPCLTVRENTERPVTVTQGTNQLVGRDLTKLRQAAQEILRRRPSETPREANKKTVPLWDGHAAERIAKIIANESAQK